MINSFKIILIGALAATTVVAAPFTRRQAQPVEFSTIDISLKSTDGQGAKRDAEAVCPSTDTVEVLEAKRRAAEDFEVTTFNPAIDAARAAGNKELQQALQCQQNRNKVLKNTCQLERANLEKDQVQIDENTKQIASNIAQVDKLCPNADTSLFLNTGARRRGAPVAAAATQATGNEKQAAGGEATTSGNQKDQAANDEKNAGAAPAGFGEIDISRKDGDGQTALENAKEVCPNSDGAAVLGQKRLTAEAAEGDFFNPIIAAAKAAGDDARANAIQCQKDRNKVLKNSCQLEKALIENDQGQIDENNQQLKKNVKDASDRCANVDTSLFVNP